MKRFLACLFLLLGLSQSFAQFNGVSGIYALNGQTFGLTSTGLKIVSGGSGYLVGDTISLTCPAIGAANKVFGTVTVGSVSGGAVTSVNVTSSGVYTALPSSGDASAINGVCSFVQASTSGAGTGAVISTLLSFNAAPYTTYIGPTNTAANNTALSGLSSSASPVQRLGFYTPGDGPGVLYTASSSACSLNSGAGDGGSQVPTSDGKCWIATAPTAGWDIRSFGVSTANADNVTQVQMAINASANGRLIVFGGPYVVKSALSSSAQIDIEGYGGGGGIYDAVCSQGLRIGTANITLLTLNGAGSAVRNLCIDSAVANTAGTAIYVAQGATDSRIEDNQINAVCVGIDITGNGELANIGTIASGNTITEFIAGCPAIRLGVASTGGSTTDTDLLNNHVYCGPGTGYGLQLLDSGGLVALGNVFSFACQRGTYIYPGANQAVVWANFVSSVVGDTDAGNDLLIDTAASSATIFGIRFSGSWSSSSTASGGAAVLIQNSASSPNVSGFDFSQAQFYLTASANGIGIDIKAGQDIQIRNSKICPNATSTGTGIIIEGAVSDVSIQNNRIGQCGDNYTGGVLATGINVATSAANIGIITGNNFINTTTPIVWNPTFSIGAIHAIVGNNIGIDEIHPSVASAATITVPLNPFVFLTGTTTVTTINGGWLGRQVQVSAPAGLSLATGGNICSNITLAAFASALLTFDGGFNCWLVK